MHPADKAVLKLAFGLGLAALLAYGLALKLPFVVCLMAAVLLARPGPPMPLLKGLLTAVILAGLVAMGVFMVPLLENYRVTGVVLTGAILYGLFFFGLVSGNPLTLVLVIAFTLIPVAGVADQALIPMVSLTLAAGIAVGTLVGSLWHAFFPDPPGPARQAKAPPAITRETASWIALRAALIVLPVFVLALTDPSFYLAAILKTVALGQQACATNARSAGRELVGSTLTGAGMAGLVWLGLSMWPNLWILMLWMSAAGLWAGARMFGVKATRFPPSFWSNALTTMLILLGPAIEDSASGKDVLEASAIRVCLFVGVALYAWSTVWVLERWRARRSEALFFDRG
jgi:hypothetical protein